jgi:hypothetical protein
MHHDKCAKCDKVVTKKINLPVERHRLNKRSTIVKRDDKELEKRIEQKMMKHKNILNISTETDVPIKKKKSYNDDSSSVGKYHYDERSRKKSNHRESSNEPKKRRDRSSSSYEESKKHRRHRSSSCDEKKKHRRRRSPSCDKKNRRHCSSECEKPKKQRHPRHCSSSSDSCSCEIIVECCPPPINVQSGYIDVINAPSAAISTGIVYFQQSPSHPPIVCISLFPSAISTQIDGLTVGVTNVGTNSFTWMLSNASSNAYDGQLNWIASSSCHQYH